MTTRYRYFSHRTTIHSINYHTIGSLYLILIRSSISNAAHSLLSAHIPYKYKWMHIVLSYQTRIQACLKLDLLILNELGYRSMAENTVEDFFEIISKRHQNGSLILTTNLPIPEWDKVFIYNTLTSAIVARLLHHSRIININAESYRYRHRTSSST